MPCSSGGKGAAAAPVRAQAGWVAETRGADVWRTRNKGEMGEKSARGGGRGWGRVEKVGMDCHRESQTRRVGRNATSHPVRRLREAGDGGGGGNTAPLGAPQGPPRCLICG